MPKLATLLRTSRAMGITFIPYARFRVQTRLSPEDCAARLRAVTQPQKLPTLLSARTLPDAHLLLKGTVTRTGFFTVPVDNTGARKYRGAQPFWLRGRFQPASGGTDLVVQVFPSLLGVFIVCFGLLVYSGATLFLFEQLLSPVATGRGRTALCLLVLLSFVLFLWAAVAIPASVQAYKMKNALRPLLSESLSDAREGGELLF